jgi:hypothetical protein
MTKSRWLTLLFVVALAVGLPLLGHALNRTGANTCALDGRIIEPGSRVVIRDGGKPAHEFCSIRCAEMWLARAGVSTTTVLVTDAITGQEIDATQAFYVRVPVFPRSEVHAFADRALAEKHADLLRGRLLEGDEMPFALLRQRH